MPNKAFITEQFINWSLSDTITRIVMTIPAPSDANSELVTDTILRAAKRSTMILDNPAPEVYLVDLQQGIQIFELRVYAAEMGHRLPARHEIHQNILVSFAEQGITCHSHHSKGWMSVILSATNNLSGRNPVKSGIVSIMPLQLNEKDELVMLRIAQLERVGSILFF